MPRYSSMEQWHVDLAKAKKMAEEGESPGVKAAGVRWHAQIERHRPDYLEILQQRQETK
jgi:hypothetical protein